MWDRDHGSRSLSRREAWLTAVVVFAARSPSGSSRPRSTSFPKPEDTAYYVGVARNLVEGRGLVSDALWSYGTPPLQFPRPAFEVWLPLPSLLAAIPIALSGAKAPIPLETAMRAAQVLPVVAGSVVSVLTWRLAADVAVERSLPVGRARTLAIGAGIASAVYLPLLLHSTLPDSTMLFGALVLGAAVLMTRVLRDPRGARWLDVRLIGIGLLMGAAALTRNEVVWLALTWVWLAWRVRDQSRAVAGSADRRRRGRQPDRVRPVGHPRLGRVRQPAAGSGAVQRALDHAGSTSSPGTTRRPSPATSRSVPPSS